MKFTLLLLSCLMLVNCGKKSKKNSAPPPREEQVVLCGDVANSNSPKCEGTFDWSIESSSKLFPKFFILQIDGVSQFNTCPNKKRKPEVTTLGDKTYIKFMNYRNLTSKTLSIKIIDLGDDCKHPNNAIFYTSDNAEYKMSNIGSNKYLIEVILNN